MKRVYFIKPIGFDGPVKIGCSASPVQRRDQLALWSPFPLEIVAEIAGGADLERRFHARFLADFQSREWFRMSDTLRATIDQINAGSFDVETLPAPQVLPRVYNKPRGGGKWTEERRNRARLNAAILRAEKQSGLVLDWGATDAERDAFIAAPHKYGITAKERWSRGQERLAESFIKRAAEIAQQDHDRPADTQAAAA